jgi:hypothetical protein
MSSFLIKKLDIFVYLQKKKMKTSDFISTEISRLAPSTIFTYKDFIKEGGSREATIKALNRKVASGEIAKIAKGKFYIPKQSIFGSVKPNEEEVIKDLLEKNGEVVGYLTGLSMYNRLGLTTQVSAITVIGKNEARPTFKRGYLRIHFIKQKNKITKENVQLLQILDAIRYIKEIPDARIDFLCNRFLSILKSLSKDSQSKMVDLAILYPPATRALLGALLDELGVIDLTECLYKSLNPITVYKLPRASIVLSNTQKWNIK